MKPTLRDTLIRIVALEQHHLVVPRSALVIPLRPRRAHHVPRVARHRTAHAVRRDEVALGDAGGVAERQRPVLMRAVDGAPDAGGVLMRGEGWG